MPSYTKRRPPSNGNDAPRQIGYYEALKATSLFMVLKFLAYMLVGAMLTALVFWASGTLFGKNSDFGTLLAVVTMFLLMPFFNLIMKYLLYMIKAAQIAVISAGLPHQTPETRSILSRPVKERIEYGFRVTGHNFGSAFIAATSEMFIDKMVIQVFNNSVDLLRAIPFIGNGVSENSTVSVIAKAVLKRNAGYADEAILSHVYLNQDADTWRTILDGVILYVQSIRELLTHTVRLILITGAVSVGTHALGLLVVFVSANALGNSLFHSTTMLVFWWTFLTINAFNVAVLRTVSATSMMWKYQIVSQGKKVSADIEQELIEKSESFKELFMNWQQSRKDNAEEQGSSSFTQQIGAAATGAVTRGIQDKFGTRGIPNSGENGSQPTQGDNRPTGRVEQPSMMERQQHRPFDNPRDVQQETANTPRSTPESYGQRQASPMDRHVQQERKAPYQEENTYMEDVARDDVQAEYTDSPQNGVRTTPEIQNTKTQHAQQTNSEPAKDKHQPKPAPAKKEPEDDVFEFL